MPDIELKYILKKLAVDGFFFFCLTSDPESAENIVDIHHDTYLLFIFDKMRTQQKKQVDVEQRQDLKMIRCRRERPVR